MKMKKSEGSYTILELLELANQAYDDGFLSTYYTKKGTLNRRGTGDTLAKFIVIELIETFDPKATKQAQLWTAIKAVESAKYQCDELQEHLEGVYDGL